MTGPVERTGGRDLARCYLGVVGPGDGASEAERGMAYEVGRRVAEAGAVLVTGGLSGVMEAACAGAVESGGLTVGLLPGSDRAGANPHLTVALPTGLGELRNGLVVRACDVLVAVGGSWGTLSELALARRTGVPVVALGSWQVARADGEPQPVGVLADSPNAAVRLALDLAARRVRT